MERKFVGKGVEKGRERREREEKRREGQRERGQEKTEQTGICLHPKTASLKLQIKNFSNNTNIQTIT